uniref:Myosin heavy chain n=1 Tax=Plectus sambesii TaxID=2011161 RepID=A0A914UJZ5_9BILA
MSVDMLNDPGWVYLRQSQEQMIASQTKKFDSKKNVWIPDAEEGFVAAEIKSTKGDMITVVSSKGVEKTIKKDDAQQMNPPKFDKTEDMANLTFLNDASVLTNLRARYFSMMIYTYSGLFCVVINPYKRLPIYTESVCKMYIGKRRNEMPPHLFAVSDEAYRNMTNDRENQSMLITGESGAGKTENTKKVISYFAIVGATQAAAKKQEPKKADAKDKKKQSTLEDQIVQTNPVLEAFGNAKTVRNNNSSRFGKFIRIHFNTAGKLAGADIEHYLLEKSRVIKQANGERSFHIFYQIMSGQIPGLKEKLFLTRPIREYHMVAWSEVTIDGVDDKEEMGITDESFDVMHFDEDEKFNLYGAAAAIMHMGEMKFKQRPREEQAECEDQTEGDLACKLFKCDPDAFVKALLKPRVKVGTEWVNKGQNLEQVNWAIGALSKAIYARVFHWLIKRCNKTLDAHDLARDFFIGVLDIAGFEIFDLNSFEQLWINFVNERLQQFFNHHMFVLEQEEYTREGIKWEFIDFGLDLQACIELIEKPLGIVSMLDEECIVPKATDMTLAQKLNDQHLGKHPNFQKPRPPKGKQAEAHMAIVHYAGTVRYNVKGWLEKNKDPLNDTAVTVLKANTGNKLITAIWEDYNTQEDLANMGKQAASGKKKGKSASFMTVSMMYRESLTKLMNMLHQTHPHFIRCIIPNELKQSGVIDANLVLNQLTCNGVLEGIRICRKGFPNRLLYPDFKQRYAVLAPAAAASTKEIKEASVKILDDLLKANSLKQEEYQCGATKVFFKAGVLAHLEELRDEALSIIITKFQCACRHYTAQCEYKRRLDQRTGVVIIQRNVRSWCTLRTWNWFKLYGRVKPLIQGSKKNEEFEEMEKRCKEMEDNYSKEEKRRKELEAANAKLIQEKQDLFMQLEQERDSSAEGEERSAKLLAQKTDLEKQVADMNDQLAEQEEKNNALTKMKKKVEQDNDSLKKNVNDLETTVKKQEAEKQSKDHQIRSLQDEMAAQDEVISKLNKEKKHQEESANFQLECQQLREALEEEQDGKTDLQRQLSKANAETQQWRARYEGEGMSRSEELEDARRKLQAKLQEMQEQLDATNGRVGSLEKAKQRLAQELEDAQVDADRANSLANSLEKKQKGFDKVIDEWKRKCDALVQELDASQRETRNASTEAFKLRNIVDEANEQVESVRRENKILAQELKDLTDQLGEGGKSVHELQKRCRRFELEKDELQQALDDAESALEAEETKVLRAQVELSQVRSEIEKRIHEKEEEFENTRKNHQRALESMQASLETEARGRAELLRMKKKLESDINELEIGLDHANKANMDAQKNIKRHQDQVRELQTQIEDEQRQREELRDQVNIAERRAAMLQTEKEDLALSYEQAERNRRQAELDAADAKETVNSLSASNATLSATKRKFEAELQQIHGELDETLSELKTTEERAKKAMMDAGRLSDELRSEQEHSQNIDRQRKGYEQQIKQEHSQNIDRQRKGYEQQIKEMQVRLDEAESSAMKGGKKMLAKLENRVRELTAELDNEGRRHAETQKHLRNKDRKARELQFQVDEDKKSTERMYDLIEKLQGKIKTYKRNIEETEQLATNNLTKYRQLQHMLEDAEERADMAENSLAKMRAKTRSGAVGGRGLSHSMSSSAVGSHARSLSRSRTAGEVIED